ncbi:MAG: NADH-quinone oxidoreductase subunit E [Kordiimonadales bacterium]|nr:MAG: NADH-quinone oxidoreductase subunit E [Kordiimonadales bacterium]
MSGMSSATEALITPFVGQTGGLLRALHALQAGVGYIDASAIPVIADVFNLTKAEVKGVVSFYSDFRRAPAGKHSIKICQAEACQAVGGRSLTDKALRALDLSFGETDSAGAVTIEPVYCLGLCASGPAAMVDGKLRGRLDPNLFADELVQLQKDGAK